jgi:hypothetical protein
LLKKPKKVKIKSKKSAKAKIKETCGDMLETNKTPKSYVATIEDSHWSKVEVGHV